MKMPEAKPKSPSGAKETGKKDEAKKTPRSNFSKMWPEDAKLSLLVEENPKKEGSKARERFQHYFGSKTVGDYLAAGGTYQDIAYDLGRQFIKVA
jgi:hypothetical protein